MPDTFQNNARGLSSPLERFYAVTPNDGADLAFFCRGIILGVAGDVKVTDMDGNAVVLPSLAAGVVHPIRAKRIWATGTTATNIVAGY